MQRQPEVVEWIRTHAVPLASTDPDAPFTDLRPLRDAVSGAVVVGVGGTTYGAHEQFTLSERIVRYLVEELGFRTVATEEDWGVGIDLDRYVVSGEGDLDDLMKTTNLPWRTSEVRDALLWLRAYNAAHAEKVRFAGVGAFDTRTSTYDAVLSHVRATGSSEAVTELEAHYEVIRPDRPDWIPWFIRQVTDKDTYVEHARATVRLVAGLSDDREGYALAVQNARQIVNFYEHYAYHLIDDGYRDEKMADNLRWWHEHTGSRIVYWSTSAHSAVADGLRILVPPRPALTFRTTGSCLREHLGDGYVSVGITFDHGTINSGWGLPPFASRPLPAPAEPAGFAERPLGDAESPLYLLDLKPDQSPPAVREWLTGPAKTRIIGSIYDPAQLPPTDYHMTGGSLSEWFDVLLHIQELTPTHLL